MKVAPLPAIPGFASGQWRLVRAVATERNPFGSTRQDTEFDGYAWHCALRCPPYNDNDAGALDAWLDEVSRADRWLYIRPPQNTARGAWSPAELVSNGTFIGGVTTGWTASGSALSVNNRRLKVKNSGAAIGTATQSLTVTADVPYVLLTDIHEGNVAAWRLRLLDGGNAAEHVSYYNQAGRVPIVHIPASTTLKVELGCNTAVAGDDVEFGGVTVARCLLVKDSLAVGNKLSVKGGPASTDGAIKAGQFVTIRLWDGWQMVRLKRDFDTDSSGEGTLTFEPALRRGVLGGGPVIVHKPFTRMKLATPVSESGLEPKNWQNHFLDAEEDPGALPNEIPYDTDTIWAWDANSFSLAPFIGSGTPTFTGDIDNWYFDSDGLLKQVAAANTPVFEFNPVTKAVKGLRLHGARTNLLLRSEELNTGAVWGLGGGATISTNSHIAPDGALTAESLTVDGTGDQYLIQDLPSYSAVTGEGVVFSYFARTPLQLGIFGGATPAGTDVFSYVDVGNGWYRQILVRTFTVTTSGTVQCIFYGGAGAGAGTFPLWGAQLEAGLFVTPYIRTTSASVARAQDNCSLTTISIPGFSAATLTMIAEVIRGHSVALDASLATLLTDANNNVALDIPGAGTTARTFVTSSGSTVANMSASTLAVGVPGRAAVAAAANDFAFSFNNGAVVTDTSGAMPSSLSSLVLGNFTVGGSFPLHGHLRRLTIFKTRKPDRQVRSMP